MSSKATAEFDALYGDFKALPNMFGVIRFRADLFHAAMACATAGAWSASRA
ncbi:MAG: hypothetical protein R3E66_12920 [bacterium]